MMLIRVLGEKNVPLFFNGETVNATELIAGAPQEIEVDTIEFDPDGNEYEPPSGRVLSIFDAYPKVVFDGKVCYTTYMRLWSFFSMTMDKPSQITKACQEMGRISRIDSKMATRFQRRIWSTNSSGNAI